MAASRAKLQMNAPAEATSRQKQDIAYRQLRDMIVTGQLAPAAAIIDARVAERLGLTRTPVRAALFRLEQEGYVTSSIVEKYSRTTVAPLTADAVPELFMIHAALEGVAVRLAAGLDAETRHQIADEMEELNSELLETTSGKLSAAVRAQDLHVRFHQVAVEAAAGPRLYAQIDAIRPQVERYERFYTHVLMSGIRDSVREHTEVIAAIRAGDPDAAQRAVEINWRNGAERYEQVLGASGRRSSW